MRRLKTSSSSKMWKIDIFYVDPNWTLTWFFCLNCRMPGLSCRFYQHKFPEVEDVVMVNVRSIAEMGAYVSLLEYNNIEGMILLSELSRRRIRSINKLIRIGRNECVVVIRVDKEKGKWEEYLIFILIIYIYLLNINVIMNKYFMLNNLYLKFFWVKLILRYIFCSLPTAVKKLNTSFCT